MSETPIIERLAGVQPRSSLARTLATRQAARDDAEATYRLLLHPAQPGEVSRRERHAVALFVALLHGQTETIAHYRSLLIETDRSLLRVIEAEAQRASHPGPYGSYPDGPLSVENQSSPRYEVGREAAADLGERLSAALEHAHLLTLHPHDTSPAALQRLLDAGVQATGIVTLSQLVAFLSFQIRIVLGLRRLVTAKNQARIAIPA